MREYDPPRYTEKNKSNLEIAEGVAWHLMCQISYYLEETNSKTIVPAKHGLDMMLEKIHHDVWEMRERILTALKIEEEIKT